MPPGVTEERSNRSGSRRTILKRYFSLLCPELRAGGAPSRKKQSTEEWNHLPPGCPPESVQSIGAPGKMDPVALSRASGDHMAAPLSSPPVLRSIQTYAGRNHQPSGPPAPTGMKQLPTAPAAPQSVSDTYPFSLGDLDGCLLFLHSFKSLLSPCCMPQPRTKPWGYEIPSLSRTVYSGWGGSRTIRR